MNLFITLIFLISLITNSKETTQGDKYFNEGYKSETNFIKSDSLFDLAIFEYLKHKDQKGLVKSYYYKGMCQLHLGNLNKSISYFTKSKNIAFKEKYFEFYVKSNSELIYIMNNKNLYNYSIKFLNENKSIINNSNEIDYYIKNIFYYDNALLNYNKRNYEESYLFLDSINIENNENHLNKSTFNLKALVYQEMNDYNKSRLSFYKALEYAPNDKIILMNLIRLFYKTDQKDSLEKYYHLYKSLYIDDNKNIVNLNNSIIEAEMFYYLGEYDKSINLLNDIEPEFENRELVKNHISCIDLKIKNNIALGEIEDLISLNEKKDSLNNVLLQQNLNISAEIIATIDKLEYENELLEIENQNAKVNMALLAGFALFLIVSIFSLIKYYYSRKDNFRVLFDMYIHLNTLNMLFKNRFSNVLSRNQKNLILNYDLDEDEELFLTHDELVKINISMQQTIDKTTNELLTNKNSKDMMKEYSINMN